MFPAAGTIAVGYVYSDRINITCDETRKIIAYPLFLIYNESISVAAIHSEWKLAEVIAIHKKGSKSERGNYRPVSLTSICCKILESFIRDHTMSYLWNSYLLHQLQYGFY